MGAAGSDRIALLIETTADLSGVQAARAETTALGRESRQASEEAALGTGKLTVSAEQMREALAASNGSLEAAAKLLAAQANAADRSTASLKNLSAAAAAQTKTALLGPSSPQLGPAVPGTPAGGAGSTRSQGLAELAAYRMEAERNAVTLGKIPPAARTASNSLGLITQAAITGQGGMNGIAVAAGNVAQGLALMSGSARAAAAATGLGAVIAITVLAAEALSKMNDELKTSQAELDHVSALQTKNLAGARAEFALAEANVATLQAKAREAAKKDVIGAAFIPGTDANVAQKRLDVALELRNTMAKKIRELDKADVDESRQRTLAGIAIEAQAQQTSQSRYAARVRDIDAQAAESVRKRELTQEAADMRAATQKRELAKQGEDYVNTLSEAAASSRDAIAVTSFDARINAANRVAVKEKEDLKDRALSATDEKAAIDYIELKRRGIVALAERERDASIATSAAQRAVDGNDAQVVMRGKLALIDEEYKKNVQLVGAAEALAVAEQKRANAHREHEAALATSVARRQSESDDPREVLQGKLALLDQEYLANIKLLGQQEALLIVEQKRAKLEHEMVQQGLAGYGLLSNAVKNHGTVVGAVAKAAADAVRLYEIYEKGKSAAISAQIQFADATAAFAVGNFAGGALHLAAAGGYAAAAVAAGAEAAGGGSGGGSAGRGGDAGTFQPQGANGTGGAQVINLYTVNPYSRETMGLVSYELGRAGVLKRPIQIPATTGLTGQVG